MTELAGALRGRLGYMGYACCYVWTFCLSSIYEFGGGPTAHSFAVSVLPGIFACAALLAWCLAGKTGRLSPQSFMRSPVPAFFASLGTLLGVMPEFGAVAGGALAIAGLVLGGFFFLFVLAQWAVSYARLADSEVVALSGLAFLLAAVVALAVSWMPLEAAALTTALMPLVGFACLRSPGVDGGPATRDALADIPFDLRNLPWKTFAGLFSIFFAYNGIVTTRTVAQSWLGGADASFLVLPALLCAGALLAARRSADHAGLGLMAKVALIAVSVPFMLASYAVEVSGQFAFADGLAMYAAAWVILILAMKGEAGASETGRGSVPVRHPAFETAASTFCLGWLLQTLGGALAFAVVPMAQSSATLYTFLMLAFVIVSGVEFFAGSFGGTCTCGDVPDGPAGGKVGPAGLAGEAAPLAPAAASSAMDAFCAEHGLSQRESEVFALWVTGHGVRDITAKLAMSESTAKTHVRHIYDKCGVYGKARLLASYEEWLSGR